MKNALIETIVKNNSTLIKNNETLINTNQKLVDLTVEQKKEKDKTLNYLKEVYQSLEDRKPRSSDEDAQYVFLRRLLTSK